MATNFSPCKGSYVLNQFPSNVMFGMNGFHVSASGAIQGHHGPLVLYIKVYMVSVKSKSDCFFCEGTLQVLHEHFRKKDFYSLSSI